jgi:hypothetical protein
MNKSVVALAIALSVASSSALAGKGASYSLITTTTAGNATKTNTNAYAGLNWSLGGGWTPALVLGLFHTRVKSNGNTEGANLSFRLNLAGGIKPGPLKLSYLNGKENLQGELGVGYDFMRWAPLISLGANAPFIGGGVDGYLNHGIIPYINVHSQDRFKKPSGTTSSQQCLLDNVNGTFSDPACTNPINNSDD